MPLDQFTNDPKFMDLSPEAKAIVLSNSEGLSPEAAKIVVGKITPLSAGDVATGAVLNAPSDAWGVAKGLFQAVSHPSEALNAMSDIGAGAISKLLPDSAFKPGSDAQRQQYEGAAGEFGQHYADRYGGVENIKRSIMEHPVETALDAATLISPFKEKLPTLTIGGKGMTGEAAAVADVSKAKNLPLSPSALNPASKTAKAFEWMSDKMLPGKWWVGRKRAQLSEGLQGMFNDAVDSLPVKIDKTQAGLTLGKALNKETYYGKFLDDITDMADKSGELSGGKPAILMDNTTQLLGELQNKSFGIGGDTLHSWFAGMEQRGGAWTPETIKQYQSLINRKLREVAGSKPLSQVPVSEFTTEGASAVVKPTTQTLEDVRLAMFDALKSDLKDAYPSLRQAQDFYSVFGPQAVKRSPFLQNIVKQSKNQPWRVVDDVFKSGDTASIDMLKGELSKFDPEAWKVISNRFVENVFDSSLIQTADEAGQMFSPGKFIKNFDRYQDVLKQYAPESFANMKQLRDISKVAMKDLGRKTPDMMDLAFSGAASGVGGLAGSAGLAVPNAFSLIMAKSMMNPTGWMKKWLTEGMKFSPGNAIGKSTTANVLQVGGKQAIPQEEFGQ